MLWFITIRPSSLWQRANLNTSYVMVHRVEVQGTTVINPFKYILCYGSSIFQNPRLIGNGHLNTSYVMVHRRPKIRLFLMVSFKYILCYGSSDKRLSILKTNSDLNTSYVMVHLQHERALIQNLLHLNTSYVMVHHLLISHKASFCCI